MATQALGDALKTNMSKQPKMTAGETYMQSVEPTLKELKGAEEEKLRAEKEKAIFTGESESRRQQALAKATEAEATAMREDPARAQYEGLIQEKAKAEFIPTQENAKDMAALFSLMNVIGFAIGSGGKAHAQQAMAAMNGMLEGHQKGRDDLYKQQRNIFETNQKQLDKKIDDLFKFMQENTKLYAKDKLAAEQNANAKFAEEGAGFLKTYYEKYGPGPTLEYMKQIVKAKEHAADLTDKEKTRAEQQAFRLQQARKAADLRRELLAMNLAAKASGTVGKALPKDKETNNEHRFRHSAIKNVQEVLTDLQDPEIRRLIGPMNQYLPDVVLNLRDKYPALAQKLARFQSEEFKIGGKALTASEQRILGPIYNWRGLTAKALEDNLKEAERAMDKEQMYLESRYPGLGEINYEVTPSSKYSVGQIIEKGNKKFRVIDVSNPNDPDVEEVK